MSIMIWTFILGVMLGASVGVMITCLCVIVKRADERSARMLNGSIMLLNNRCAYGYYIY